MALCSPSVMESARAALVEVRSLLVAFHHTDKRWQSGIATWSTASQALLVTLGAAQRQTIHSQSLCIYCRVTRRTIPVIHGSIACSTSAPDLPMIMPTTHSQG